VIYLDKNQEMKSLINQFKENLVNKQKELKEKEKFLDQFALKLNEKEDELLIKEKAIQKLLNNEIESIIDQNDFPKEKRSLLIRKITHDILLNEADEIEEDDLRERKFLRNEYKKLKHSLFHELNDIHYDSEDEEDDFEVDDIDIERIKQELKDELDYLEKRHPGDTVRMSKQDLIDLRTFDPSNSDEEINIIENYVELYKKAKLKYNKFIFLTIISGTEK